MFNIHRGSGDYANTIPVKKNKTPGQQENYDEHGRMCARAMRFVCDVNNVV